ncbi:hypothetical protein [Aurantibacter sp.]|uniref:hypothetical protein n=1 Tax=Aurantibacter sp. TaxID=2807103 RepID=UPI003265BE61
MKTVLVLFLFTVAHTCLSQKNKPTVKSILLEQLENTHNNQSWFVPSSKAIQNLTVRQANWKNKKTDHSISELVSHLIFWNQRDLTAFKGDSLPSFNYDNNSTFKKPNKE